MKKQSTEEMVVHIRAILEQNQDPQELVHNDDVRTLSLEALIANSLEEAVAMAVQNADESLFQNISTAVYAGSWEDYDGDPADIMDMYVITRSTHGEGVTITKLVMPKCVYAIEAGNVIEQETGEVVGGVYGSVHSALSNENGVCFVLTDSFNRSLSMGAIPVGVDVQRILQIGCDSWHGIVKDLLDKSSAIYRMCNNKYLKAVGVKDRPVAFRDFGSGKRKIEIFPAAKKWVALNYIARPKIKTDWLVEENRDVNVETGQPVDDGQMVGVIECDDSLYEASCYYCAYLVAMVQGWQTANTYRQEAVQALQLVSKENVQLAANKLAAES